MLCAALQAADIEEENGSGERPQSIVMIDILKQMDQTRREIHQVDFSLNTHTYIFSKFQCATKPPYVYSV